MYRNQVFPYVDFPLHEDATKQGPQSTSRRARTSRRLYYYIHSNKIYHIICMH